MGFLDKLKLNRLKDGLSKTRESVFGKVSRLLVARTKVDDALLEELEETLIAGDVGVETTEQIIQKFKSRVRQDGYQTSDELIGLLREEIQGAFLDGAPSELQDPFEQSFGQTPHVIMIVGVNGVGKTTTIAKLAFQYREKGKKVLLAAADTYRAAANEQLEIWAQRAGVAMVQQARGTDPGAVAHDALASAIAHHADVMIVDTAGRLHTKVNLMRELQKISRVLQKQVPDAPHETLLVLDAATGQNAVQQVKIFSEAIGVTGLILTKLDGTAKGGIVIAISKVLKIPVKYIGVGEAIEDIQPFDREAFVEALFSQ
ncbi:MAG: signal recognition particle-docking protein FtsY [Bacteroidota bacterium]